MIGDRTVLDLLLALATHPADRGQGIAAAAAVRNLSRRLGIDVDPSRVRYWREPS